MTARFSNIIGLAAAIAAIAFAPTAHATNFTSNDTGGGYWHLSSSWNPSGVPSSGDTVEILGGDTITVTNSQQITEISVLWDFYEGDGFLIVDEGGVLTLTGSPPSLSVTPADGLQVQGGRLVVSSTMTFSGSGSIQVQPGGVLELSSAETVVTLSLPLTIAGALRVSADDITLVNNSEIHWEDATIEIGPNSGSGTVTYTNSDSIVGSVTIKRNPVNASGVAAFDNQGQIIADNGTILLDSSLYQVTDTAGSCSTPRWGATSDGTLRFNRGGDLAGHFSVAGTLVINTELATSGLFKFSSGGAVDIVEDADSFNVTGTGGVGSGNHYCSGSSCSSTAFPFTSDVSCP